MNAYAKFVRSLRGPFLVDVIAGRFVVRDLDNGRAFSFKPDGTDLREEA